MHTAQIILVEIEDEDTDSPQAFAESFLDGAMESGGTWFDWYGGLSEGLAGRWSSEVFSGDVLKYSDDPDLAEKKIAEFLEMRQKAVEYGQSVIKGVGVESISYDMDNHEKYDAEGYALYKMGQVLSNFWCSDSGVYDAVTWGADLKYFRERLQENPDKQYLVVVDFHF
jgi:hypothetical protein